MAESSQKPAGSGQPGSPIRPRTLAILVMVAGVVAFVLTRVVFGDRVLCLLGSSLITFTGLAMIIAGRNKGYGRQMPKQAEDTRQPNIFQIRRVPPGLRAAIRRAPSMRTTDVLPTVQENPTPEQVEPQPVEADQEPIDEGTLLGQVMKSLQNLGAQVAVEARHDDRGILQVLALDGHQYVALVREDVDLVDVAEVRALAALITSGNKAGGYLVAGGIFTDRAYEWAEERRIRLIRADELDQLNV